MRMSTVSSQKEEHTGATPKSKENIWVVSRREVKHNHVDNVFLKLFIPHENENLHLMCHHVDPRKTSELAYSTAQTVDP